MPGLEAVAQRPIIVVGELHGTAETPAAVVAIARELATRPVAVGLEVSQTEDARIAAYLSSRGDAASRAALLAGPFWHAPREGRESEAMLALLEGLRAMKASGHDVVVVPFDIPLERFSDPNVDRDQMMAENILAARKRLPASQMVVLVGNWHSRTSSDPDGDPMTATLRKSEPSLVALRAEYAGGSAWLCEDGDGPDGVVCGPRKLLEKDAHPARTITLGGVKDHDGAIHIGPATASPPAVPIGQ